MKSIPAWLKVWMFLDEVNRDLNTIYECTKTSDLSPAGAYEGAAFLEELGLINLIREGRRVNVVRTQKFFVTRTVFKDVLDCYVSDKGTV